MFLLDVILTGLMTIALRFFRSNKIYQSMFNLDKIKNREGNETREDKKLEASISVDRSLKKCYRKATSD